MVVPRAFIQKELTLSLFFGLTEGLTVLYKCDAAFKNNSAVKAATREEDSHFHKDDYIRGTTKKELRLALGQAGATKRKGMASRNNARRRSATESQLLQVSAQTTRTGKGKTTCGSKRGKKHSERRRELG